MMIALIVLEGSINVYENPDQDCSRIPNFLANTASFVKQNQWV
jgi:hypothetical protein